MKVTTKIKIKTFLSDKNHFFIQRKIRAEGQRDGGGERILAGCIRNPAGSLDLTASKVPQQKNVFKEKGETLKKTPVNKILSNFIPRI